MAIPASTVDRAVDQLLAKGHIARGYLGAALRRVRLGSERGVLVIGIDADGPAAHGGLLVGDTIVSWNGTAVTRVREIMRLLAPNRSARGRARSRSRRPRLKLGITIGERPAR